MRYESLGFFVLVAATSPACAGEPPRSQTTGELFDAKPASGVLPIRPHQRPDNTSITFDGSGDFGDFALVERQSCAPGKHLCGTRGCCDDNENCGMDGCCDKPRIECGTGCYDPEESVCCEDKNATCDVGEKCTETGCCPEDHPASCNGNCYDPKEKQCCDNGDICDRGDGCVGDGICCDGYLDLCGDYCFDPIFSTCCIDGDSSWTCDQGRQCCIESHGCVYSTRELCCAVGACDDAGSCCENECCTSGEECGSNGYCTRTQDPTVTRTVTGDGSANETGGPSRPGRPGQPGQPGRGGTGGWRNLCRHWTAFSVAAGAVAAGHLPIFL